jgi:uracil phosphoribosyltransferase
VLKEEPILVTVLRAGIPFHYGVQRIFSEADSGFIGAQRN